MDDDADDAARVTKPSLRGRQLRGYRPRGNERPTPVERPSRATERSAGLSGRDLRIVALLTVVGARRPLTTAEIVEQILAEGVEIAGRAGKAVSDALRAEVAKGRVRAVDWGTYEAATRLPRSTGYRLRQQARAAIARAGADSGVDHTPEVPQPFAACDDGDVADEGGFIDLDALFGLRDDQ